MELKDAFRKLLPIAVEWNNIGALLGIDENKLKAIKSEQQQVNNCLRAMISEWLNGVTPSPTWSKLADVVEPFNERIANEIRDSVAV